MSNAPPKKAHTITITLVTENEINENENEREKQKKELVNSGSSSSVTFERGGDATDAYLNSIAKSKTWCSSVLCFSFFLI